MKRTKKPGPAKEMIRFVNYYDKNRAQRWDAMIREHKDHVQVLTLFGEKVDVPKSDIIGERDVTLEFLKSIDLFRSLLENWPK